MLVNTHSYYSLRYGTVSPKDLLKLISELGYKRMAITDINNTSACLDMARLAKKNKLEMSLGVDFRNSIHQKYVVIAKDNQGFYQLNKHLSEHLHAKKAFDDRAPYHELSNCSIIYPFDNYSKFSLEANEYIGLEPKQLIKLQRKQQKISKSKLLAMPHFSFRNKKDFNTHRLLRAINENCLLSKLEPNQQADSEDLIISKEELYAAYGTDFSFLLEQADQLLQTNQIHFDFDNPNKNHNQSSYTNNKELDFRLMKKICKDNLYYRYPRAGKRVLDRLEKELGIIYQKNFVSYFLINWRILKYARSKGYFYVGRGSGANSIVAYLMRITDVDPIELDLYFERFINLYRQNPPDFDIDFSWTDRDDVTRYIFERFPYAALQGTYVSFQYRAVIRELGKVFGLPKEDIDLLSKGHFNAQQLDQMHKLVLKYSVYIQDFPNYLSVHSSGILIADRDLNYFGASFLPPKNYPTVQFDMVVAEDVGLYKFDILSQRGLGKIKDSLKIIAHNHPKDPSIDIHDLRRFKKDSKIKELLRTAKAIGCFYVESPAMRMLLKKLQVDNYLGLVAASSVIRPGVSKSGMMKEYIQRYRFPEKRKDAHPIMLEIMPETFGVMVYQEDVIKVAHYFAGLSLAEADVLRRGMSGKFRSREEFEKVRLKFFDNCEQKGYNKELSAEIWRQTESFAGYAFAKGHSASYAVESYQSLFLKAYYPIEYMLATLNNSGGFYSREHYAHEARQHGAIIEAPCVNRSDGLCIINGKIIFLGLAFIKGLESNLINSILNERENGPYKSIRDLIKRLSISLEQIIILIRIGALRFTEKDKKELLWEAHFLLGHKKKSKPTKELFNSEPKNYTFPPLYTAQLEDAFDEIEHLGFPLSNPFSLLANELPKGISLAKDLSSRKLWTVKCLGYLVALKTTKTTKGKRMLFGTFIDQEGAYIDTVHFPPSAAKYPFKGKGIYTIIGKLTEEFDCYIIEVSEMHKEDIIEDPRYSDNSSNQTPEISSKREKSKEILK